MDSTYNFNIKPELDFLSGGGEMENRIRSFDWSVTSLGPIEMWPLCLKSAVNIVLQSLVPMIIVWEKEGWLIYNDAYSVFAGKRHPQLLGSKVEEGWPEVAEFNRNMLNAVLKGEKLSYQNQKLILYRNNVAEDVWMNLHYSPIMNDQGQPAGVLAIVFETTQGILAGKKQEEAEAALKTERQRLHDLFMNAPASIAIIAGPELRFQLANDPYRKLIGKDYPLEGLPILEVLPELEPGLFEIVNNVAFKGERFIADELPVKLDWENNGKPYERYLNFIYETLYEKNIPNGLIAFAYDVTGQVKARKTVEDQNKVLEMVTAGESLENALAFLIKSIEAQSHGSMIGSVLLMDADGIHLRHGSAPNLPEAYNKQIDGIKIGPVAGSCGTAAFRKEQVFVSDILKDPLWENFRDLAIQHGLYSCWSSPILSGDKVLGTFALYSHGPMEPLEGDIQNITFATRTAKLIIERKQIEKELKEREEHLRALVISTSDVIYIMSPDWSEMGVLDGRIFVPDTGKPLGDWKWFHSNIPLEDQPRLKKAIDEAIRKKSIFQLEHGVNRADGTKGWTSSRAVPILNANGEIEKWFGAATDITDRKNIEDALKESEERFRSMADQAPMMVFIIEPSEDAIVSYWSKAWLEYTGQTLEQAQGRAWDGIVHPQDLKVVVEYYTQAYINKTPYTIPAIRLRRHDGEYRWHLFKGNPRLLPGGIFMGFVGVGIDIHEQQKAFQELESKNNQLLRINNDLDGFIYTASHDLKAPVSNIEGLIDTLKDTLFSMDPQMDEMQMILAMIDKSILRFKNTIIDLTDISKVQKNLYTDLEELDLKEVIDEVLDTIAKQLKEANAIIDIDVDCKVVKFSRVNLKSIIYNLISNAVKYRSPHRVPEVKVSCFVKDEEVVLKVSDNGLGIKDENKKKLFSMFKRFHDHVEGTGIGLYIVKRIIDNSGGRVEVESEAGKGTTFTVFLKAGLQ